MHNRWMKAKFMYTTVIIVHTVYFIFCCIFCIVQYIEDKYPMITLTSCSLLVIVVGIGNVGSISASMGSHTLPRWVQLHLMYSNIFLTTLDALSEPLRPLLQQITRLLMASSWPPNSLIGGFLIRTPLGATHWPPQVPSLFTLTYVLVIVFSGPHC